MFSAKLFFDNATEFSCALSVSQNTLESIIALLPALVFSLVWYPLAILFPDI